MKRAAGILTLLLVPGALPAKDMPAANVDDPRVRVINFVPNEPVPLVLRPSDDLTVILGADEHVQSVSLSSQVDYIVTVSQAADSFIVHAIRPTAPTNLAILTERRSYAFRLSTAEGTAAPYLVRFTYFKGAPHSRAQGDEGTNTPPAFAYRLSGTKALRPIAMSDDGTKTYIKWSEDQAIPAVFARDKLGREEMVNGYMRGDVFTIDRVHDQLVFRIDKARADAARKMVRKPR